mmetsp:Transcript_69300/g.122669  ORF Transcript_69300/g.122669 Transcript_69300/m.122669 type:complete len:292 (-) Transcript_69300:143-1018(-)
MASRLNKRENATVGAVAGIADITGIQWAYYLKNARQQGLPLTLNPRILYRGYGANCINIAAGTCFQFAFNGMLEGVLTDGSRKLTVAEQLGSGFVAGFASGIVASPAELVMTQQQVKGGSLGSNVSRLVLAGPSACLRGLTPTCFREGIFASAYLGLAPVLRTKLQEKMPSANEEALRVLAAVGGAAVCGALSHPFDTVKTCMQGDVERRDYGTPKQTARAIWSQGGLAAMYRGIEFRFLRQVWQVWVLDLLRVKLSPILFPASCGLVQSAGFGICEGSSVGSLAFDVERQ